MSNDSGPQVSVYLEALLRDREILTGFPSSQQPSTEEVADPEVQRSPRVPEGEATAIFDRLYRSAKEHSVRRRVDHELGLRAEAQAYMFEPRVLTSYPGGHVSEGNVTERLYRDGLERMRRREASMGRANSCGALPDTANGDPRRNGTCLISSRPGDRMPRSPHTSRSPRTKSTVLRTSSPSAAQTSPRQRAPPAFGSSAVRLGTDSDQVHGTVPAQGSVGHSARVAIARRDTAGTVPGEVQISSSDESANPPVTRPVDRLTVEDLNDLERFRAKAARIEVAKQRRRKEAEAQQRCEEQRRRAAAKNERARVDRQAARGCRRSTLDEPPSAAALEAAWQR